MDPNVSDDMVDKTNTIRMNCHVDVGLCQCTKLWPAQLSGSPLMGWSQCPAGQDAMRALLPARSLSSRRFFTLVWKPRTLLLIGAVGRLGLCNPRQGQAVVQGHLTHHLSSIIHSCFWRRVSRGMSFRDIQEEYVEKYF